MRRADKRCHSIAGRVLRPGALVSVLLGLDGFAQAQPTAASGAPSTQRAADQLVEVTQLAADIRVELRYATANNFTKHVIYPASARCYLRAPVAARLADVQRALRARGLGLKVYDCYRPRSAQKTLWDIVPDERYVASPQTGSRHNRGAAVDLTLVDKDGRELPMPTPYDDFTVKAHRNYQALSKEALRNRQTLEDAMAGRGFIPLPTEWWHFDDPDSARYPLTDIRFEELAQR